MRGAHTTYAPTTVDITHGLCYAYTRMNLYLNGAQMFDLTWNTGRRYTASGQTIHAVHQIDGSVIFADHSRGVDGHIAADKCPTRFLSEADFKAFVMDHYDSYDYDHDRASFNLLMYKVNS